MNFKLPRTSVIAGAATLFTAIVGATGSGAVAQDHVPVAIQPDTNIQFTNQPIVQPLPATPRVDSGPSAAAADDGADSLAELVSQTSSDGDLTPELHCLAGAIYFEAKGESLPGQLAVGRVIVARTKSGRFPTSYCGVVYQPSQFSFVRGRSMPGINKASRHWREAVALARIADSGTWRSPVEGAMFFHATHVSPNWRLTRVARVDGHVFYR